MSKPKQPAQCRFCQFWQPKYCGVGACTAQGKQDAKFWVTDDEAGLLTKADFACIEFRAIDTDLKDEVL